MIHPDFDSALKERDEYKEKYENACELVAKMHAAAMGEIRGPKRGVIEDVEDLRKLALRPNLFQNGLFKLRSGSESRWKIECDALTKEDWDTLAIMAIELLQPFKEVHGVPRGGIPFADALRPYCTSSAKTILIAEDVVTTGGSIEKYLLQHHKDSQAYGVCVFARQKIAGWITPLFQMGR